MAARGTGGMSRGAGPIGARRRARAADRGVGGQGAHVADIQRSRLLAAGVRAVDELGWANTTVADIVARSRISRRTFYETFANREDCLAAVLEDILGVIAGELAGAGLEGLGWRERVRPLDGEVVVTATNLGTGYVDPTVQPVTVADKLPPGVEAVAIEGTVGENFTKAGTTRSVLECSLQAVSCVYTGMPPVKRFTRDFRLFVPPYEQIQMRIWVRLTGAKTGALNEASIAGGGAHPVSVLRKMTVSDAPVPFGANAYELDPEEVGGGVDTQAGSHPFQFTATYEANTATSGNRPVGLTKDLSFKLPAGFVGDPTQIPQCKLADFLREECPQDTAIGVSRFGMRFMEAGTGGGAGNEVAQHDLTAIRVPLYNIEPAVGEPARFGFIFEKAPVFLTTSVRTGSDYGVTVTVRNITQEIEFLWNDPVAVAAHQRDGQPPGVSVQPDQLRTDESHRGTGKQ
jgi:AcrR family transcriptional regulator